MTAPAIDMTDVGLRYPGGAVALEHLTLRVQPGELLAIIGPNGGGKTTLLRLVLGLLHPTSGRVQVFGEEPRIARRRGIIGYVPQHATADLRCPISARTVVEMGAAARLGVLEPMPAEARDRVDQALELVGAADLARHAIGRLSGGQRQRIWIARALAAAPRILALDEPTVGIDAVGQRRFGDLLARLHAELELTILLVSHDVRTIAGGAGTARCDRVACLRRTLHFHAAPAGITPQVLAEVFEHDLAEIFGDVQVDAHRTSAEEARS